MCPTNVPCFDRLPHSFAGHRKKTVWSTWKSLPELTLADETKEIPYDAMNTIERFVTLLFDRTKVDHARRKLFP